MVLACVPGDAFANQRSIAAARLDGQKFVAFEQGLVIRQKVDRFLAEHGASVEVVHEFDNIETIKKSIEAGAGVAILPEPMLRQEVRAGTLCAVRLEGKPLIRPLGIIHRRGAELSAATQGFIDLLRGAAASTNGKRHKVRN